MRKVISQIILSLLILHTSSFKARFLPCAGPATVRRFLKHTEDYVNGFSVEADLREKHVVLDIEAYNKLRRENSAVRYCFGLFGLCLNADLPDEIFEHPVLMRMHLAAVDMITWANVSLPFCRSLLYLIFIRAVRTSTPTTWSKPWDT